MTIEETIQQLRKNRAYAIAGYTIGPKDVILFVHEYSAAQEEIPSVLDGRSVRIAKSI